MNRYPIPADRARIELKIANSRFIATIGPATTVDAAKAFIDEMRAEFSDASHNVYAFKVGYGASVTEGMSDDGEPAGTAGKPALAVLRGEDLGDVVVVVTRYFGGTKLGTGGLVRSYTQSVKEALKAMPVGERVHTVTGTLKAPYSLYEQIRRLVEQEGGTITEETFGAEVTLRLRFIVDERDPFEHHLRELSAGQLAVDWDA
ncbi:MAG: YigZ family protein [Anaerolineae bacterium]